MLIALLAVVVIGFLLVVDWLDDINKNLRSIQGRLEVIQGTTETWARLHRQPPSFPDPYLGLERTDEEGKQEEEERRRKAERDDQIGQAGLKQLVEVSGGWKTARVFCRRGTSDPLEWELVLAATDRIYTASGRLGFFYRDGEATLPSVPEPGAEVRYAASRRSLFAENSEGRILNLTIMEERVNQPGLGVAA